MTATVSSVLPQMGEAKYVDVEGRRVRYLEYGVGAPILLVHGWIGSAENFHKWIPALEGRRKMIIPDLPGFGETAPLAGPHSIAALGAFLDAFSSAIGLGLYDLGGLCLGATVALELARRDPERVRQLVLHTPIYSRRAVSRPFRMQAAFFMNRLVYGVAVRAFPRAAREWLKDALVQDFESWLRAWEQPVLMVVAADDWILDHDAMQRLTESMQTAEVVMVPDAGHGWTDALVKAQAAAISGFLAPDPI